MKAERGTLADRHTSGPYGTYIGKYAVIDSREEKGKPRAVVALHLMGTLLREVTG
jgi:hypothetical protein